MEIAKRQRRLADEQVEIDAVVALLEEEYGRLQRNLTLFVNWSQKFPNPDQVYSDNHGPELAIALEELANLADSFRSSNNVLGYRADYVPLATFPEIRIQFWGGEANTNGGYLKIAREAEKDATIVGAENAAEIKRLLLQQTDALIELDVARAEYNAVLAEHNSLVTQYQALLRDKEYTNLSSNSYLTNPALRIISDNENRIAQERFDILVNYAYLAAKALEYELLSGATIPYQDLYTARTVDEVLTFFSTLNSTYGSLLDTSSLYPQKLSLAKDILRLTDTRVNNMLPFTVDSFVANSANWPSRADCNTPIISVATTLRTCLLQAFLLEQRIEGTEQIVFSFPTHLEDFYDGTGNDYNVRITPLQNSKPSGNCSEFAECTGVWVNLLMDQYTNNGQTPRLYLTHDGQSAYLDNNSNIVYYRPAARRFPGQAIPSGFPQGSALRQSMNINVNHVGVWQPGVSATSNFYLRSAVASGWRVELDLDSPLNVDLKNDFDAITDLELNLQTMFLTVNPLLAAVQAEMEVLREQGEPIPAALQAEYDQMVAALQANRNQENKITDEKKSAVLNSMVESFNQTAVTAPYIDPGVTHGLYSGIIGAAGFTEFGIEIEATAVNGSQPINATLCITCSATHNTAATFNGTFVETGTPTDTFSLVSDPFIEDIAGNAVTKVITLTGSVINNGGTITGIYEEHTVDAVGRETFLTSELYASRPKRVPGAATPTATIALDPGDLPHINWNSSEANCTYQLYRSAQPYFVSYPRQLASSMIGVSFIDTFTATIGQPIFYRLRALSCDANFDYLEANASYYRDSQEIGVFNFGIVPGIRHKFSVLFLCLSA